jgi:hypothetical protein
MRTAFILIFSGFLVLIVGTGSAIAQQTIAWQGQTQGSTLDNYNTHNVVDAEGNLYLMWSDYPSVYSVGSGAPGTNHLDKIAPNKAVYFSLHPDESAAPYDIEISPASSGRQLLLVVTVYDQDQFRFSEYDTNGKALWSSPVVVQASGFCTYRVDAGGNVTALFTGGPSGTGASFTKISSKGVKQPWVPATAKTLSYPQIPLPNGNWLLYTINGNANANSIWGVYNPSTGKELFGGSNFQSYKFVVSSTGTIAVCGFNGSTFTLETFDQNGAALGTFKSPYIIGDLAFDRKDNLYISSGGSLAAGISTNMSVQKFGKEANLEWTVQVPGNWGYENDLQGANDGVFFYFVVELASKNSETFYHLNSAGNVDAQEPLPPYAEPLFVSPGTHNDNYVSFMPNVGEQTTQYVQRFVEGPSIAGVSVSQVAKANTTATITVTSNVPAPAGGMRVALSSNDAGALIFSAPLVIIPEGETSVTTTVHVGILKSNPATITATGSNGVLCYATVSY